MTRPSCCTLILLLLGLLFLTGCASPEKQAVRTVEQYLQGIADQNVNQVSNLSCESWESSALMEVYSFQLVKTSLDNVECSVLDRQEDGIRVRCTGAIVTTYNNEVARIDLDHRTYFVRQESGDLFVCGYQ
jgi:PBP1b-binding outer membrane lipoprotein LpoB